MPTAPEAEKLLDWTSGNGNWQIVAQVKTHPFDVDSLTHSIVLRRYDKERRGFMTYHLGVGRNMQKVPAYVLAKYNEFLDEIRVRYAEIKERVGAE